MCEASCVMGPGVLLESCEAAEDMYTIVLRNNRILLSRVVRTSVRISISPFLTQPHSIVAGTRSGEVMVSPQSTGRPHLEYRRQSRSVPWQVYARARIAS